MTQETDAKKETTTQKAPTARVIPGHDYDGVQELDNPPPTWFNLLFVLTIVFGAAYFGYYQLGPGKSQSEELAAVQRAEREEEAKRTASDPTLSAPDTDETLLALTRDPARLAEGKTSYATKCASCHGSLGQGGIGPNLTDAYWIHGGKPTQLAAVITNGVAEKGMPPWGPLLARKEIQSLTAYLRTLQGTNPPGAKAPQGELVE
jgi:cytochrome c oxidase cbb3-type subunit 3